MLTKLRTLASLYQELGPRWLAFRVAYVFRLRTGLIRLQFPQYQWDERPLAAWLKPNVPSNPEAYSQWRKQNSPKFFFDSYRAGEPPKGEQRASEGEAHWNSQPAIEEANRLLDGEITYFAHQYHRTGFPPNWHSIPSTLQLPSSAAPHGDASRGTPPQADSIKHWSIYSDESDTDIKFIWEPNRIAFVYALVRAYSATGDEKYAEAFWALIEDWAEKNPPNTGVNWMDGQEAALRLMAWTFGYYQFSNSPASTPQRIALFTTLIASHAERIYNNTAFAIFTRGNHAITEALGLWMTGLLFPELKHAEKYLSFGKISLEREAAEQIFLDGTYSMYSLNYHRFVLHLYFYAIRLAELNHFPLSAHIHQAVTKSLEYLSELINPQTGEMPVYGSNDGALVLPLNNCDFTDYRPLLQLGWCITKKQFLFEPGPWDEDVFWLCNISRAERKSNDSESVVEAQISKSSFPHGGTYILRGSNSKALLRCTDFASRPSHADQLHMDLWMHGHNIAIDAGTYLYSGEGIWRNGLARTNVHNTVSVDGKDQMQMVSRFTWTNWAKGKVLKHTKNIWQGEHDGYKPISHKRTVMMLDDDCWLVIDNLTANESHHYALHWLLNDNPFEQKENSVLLSLNELKYKVQAGMVEGDGAFSLVCADPDSTRGWRSRYYAHKEPALSLMLEANQKNITFWTFFGSGDDVIEIVGNSVLVNSQPVYKLDG